MSDILSFDYTFVIIREDSFPEEIYAESSFEVDSDFSYGSLSSDPLVYPVYDGSLSFSLSDHSIENFEEEYIGDLSFRLKDHTSVVITELPYSVILPSMVKVGSTEWLSYKTIGSVSCDEKIYGGVFSKYDGNKLYSVIMNPNMKEVGFYSYENNTLKKIYSKKVEGLYNEASYDLELDSIIVGMLERKLYFHEYFTGLFDRPTFGSAHVPDRYEIKPRNVSVNPNIDISGSFEIIDGIFVVKDALFKINKTVPERSVLSIRFSVSASSEMIVFMGLSEGNMEDCYSLHISPYLAILVNNFIDKELGPVSETVESKDLLLHPGIFYHLWIEHYKNMLKVKLDGITIFEINPRLGPNELYVKSNNICSLKKIEIAGTNGDYDLVLDMNDYRSFCNQSTYIGDNFWVSSSRLGPSTLFRAYFEKEPFYETVVNSVELGTTGIISFADSDVADADYLNNKMSCSEFEVIGLPLYETIIAPNKIENKTVPVRVIAPKEKFPFGYLFV